jgi:hypothetical protein
MKTKQNFTIKLLRAIKKPNRIIVRLMRSYCRWMSDETFLKIEHRLLLKEKLDFNNLETFNQKLQWLKINNTDPKFSMLVDKYLVRNYVAENIGERYLIPLLGVYDSADEIDISKLPPKFVLKANHGSAMNVICTDKSKLNWEEEKEKLNKWLTENYYWHDRERPYKNIVPKIICEEFIKANGNEPPMDYKIFCFNGVPQFFFIASDRGSNTKFDFFDMEWNRLPVKQYYPNSSYTFTPPEKWNEMVECAKKLSKGFTHVRVDFYIDSEDNLLFGEMTFGHFGGVTPFEPKAFDKYFGQFLELPLESSN